jgi:signal transduction histidine kinase
MWDKQQQRVTRIYGAAQDITKRKEAEQLERNIQQLKASFQKEQATNELIQRVISMLSHDLRTPLAAISSSRDLLRHYYDRLSEEKRKERLDTIERQIQYALQILEDTVHIARGNLSEKQFNPIPINIAALCQISVDEIRVAQSETHNIQFINVGNIEIAQVDEVLVNRILVNLLSNAIKYLPEDGEIRLELDLKGEWLIFRVIDQGMGIKDADLPQIFDPFYRSEDVNAIKGTGLGLSIVQDCVERHHGRIYVESTWGEGSTFVVELPTQVDNPTT